MRYANCILMVLMTASLGSAQTLAQSGAELQTVSHLFDYDSKQPLGIREQKVEDVKDAYLRDITYVGASGGRVAAYLVVPKGNGPFAAVLFGHWGNGTRAEFIPEAKIYARAGAISLIPDYPWERPPPWRKTLDHFDKPTLDRDAYIQAVVDLRRGMDLLLARNDVDPARLAYIGHSYGAQWGAILTAIDRRMKTSVLVAGVAETADLYLRNDNPGLVEFRKSQPAGQLERYVRGLSELDAIHFVGHAAPIPLLLQFGNYEQYFDRASTDRYIAAASHPKTVLHYDAGHDMNEVRALKDRHDWLVKNIGLRSELKGLRTDE